MRRGYRSSSVPVLSRQPLDFRGYWRPPQGLPSGSMVQPPSALLAGSELPPPVGPQAGLPFGSMPHPPFVPPALLGPQTVLPLGSMVHPPLVHTPRSQLQKPARNSSSESEDCWSAGGLKAGRAAAAHQGSARVRVTARTAAFLRNMSSSSREVGPAASNGRPVAPSRARVLEGG